MAHYYFTEHWAFGFCLTWGDGSLRGEETASKPSPRKSRGPGCISILALPWASSCAPAPGTAASGQQRAGAGVLQESRPSWPEVTPVCPGSLWLHPPGSLPLCSPSPGPQGRPRVSGRAAGQARGPAGQEATSTQQLGSPARGLLQPLTSFLQEPRGACHHGSPAGLRHQGPVTEARVLLGRAQASDRPAWPPALPVSSDPSEVRGLGLRPPPVHPTERPVGTSFPRAKESCPMALAPPASANARVPTALCPAWWAQTGVLGPNRRSPALAVDRSVSCWASSGDPHLKSYI